MGRENVWRRLAVRWWPAAALLLYVGCNLFLLAHHENWRDEAQAWQIARNLGLSALFDQLRYEGHPCLWYLILMPFAKLGLPFSCMGFISLAFMSGAVWIILRKSPFLWPVRLILVFSSFFVYFYPVISRSYSMIPLLLAWIAVLYPDRKQKGLAYGAALALLTQTHVYMVGLSFLLSFFWFWETVWEVCRRKERNHVEQNGAELPRTAAGLGLSLCSGLFLVWELAGSLNLNPGIDVNISSSLSYNLYRISVGSQWAVDNALGIGLSDRAWKLVLAAFFAGLLLLFWFSWKEALMFAGTVFTQVLMFTYIYLSSEQKAMLLFHELIFILWLILKKEEGKENQSQKQNQKHGRSQRRKLQAAGWQILLILFSLLASDGHVQKIRTDIEQPYSAGEAAAEFISEELPEESVLIAAGDVGAFSVAAYLPEREIWYPLTRTAVTFSVWNEERMETIGFEEMLLRVREKYPGVSEFYLVCSGTNQVAGLEEHLPEMRKLFHQDAMLPEEAITIYQMEL